MTCVKCCTIVGDFCPIVSITEFFTVYNWHLVNCWLTTGFVNDCSNTRSYDNVYFFTFHYILLFLCEEFRNWRLMKWSRDYCVIFLSVRSTEAKDNSMKKNKQQQIRMFKSVCFHILMCFFCVIYKIKSETFHVVFTLIKVSQMSEGLKRTLFNL